MTIIETNKIPVFTADEEKRIFTLDGRRIPSVSDVLRDNGLAPRFIDEAAMRRGSYVHALCEYLDQGDYAPAEAERLGLAGYIESWRNTKIAESIKVISVEKRLFDPTYGFCGRPDRLVKMGNRQEECILDLKTGNLYDYIRYQLAGYQYLHGPPDQYGRCAVILRDDGGAGHVERFYEDEDYDIFLALLAATNTRLKHGIITWGTNGLESTCR